MTKEVREMRKNELEEVKKALEILQNYCEKYDDENVEKEVGYIFSNEGVDSVIRKKVDKLDTPSKIETFLKGVSSYVSAIYYR